MPSEIDFSYKLSQFPTANPVPKIFGDLRTKNSDFIVDEVLSFQPSGEGEHLFLQVKKIDSNTDWVARQLQKKSALTSKDIGYAGKKDRHSISTQWFSLHLPGKEIDLAQLAGDEYEIIQAVRHNKKLRRGSLKENRFSIIIRNVDGILDHNAVANITKFGVPNYFGPQRFGFAASNLDKAEALLSGKIKIKNRNKRGLIISSARSFLFNCQLAQRIKNKTWLTAIKGDCLMLDSSQSYFVLNALSLDEQQRIDDGDLHISGWLAGKQESECLDDALAIEQFEVKKFSHWLVGLNKLKLDSARRPYRCLPKNFIVESEDKTIRLSFSLAKGSFATSVIRELINITDKKIAVGKVPEPVS